MIQFGSEFSIHCVNWKGEPVFFFFFFEVKLFLEVENSSFQKTAVISMLNFLFLLYGEVVKRALCTKYILTIILKVKHERLPIVDM